ncbi:hypothetical protein Goarm_006528 [Gossypium armourianum]|uniref:Uncharacterized protein n=1 Tax=Gossypium armourianum TaxID=34283 RepID=A0A7J9JJS6_9ROSI|nr:hypothetical protein [Gossypium armourianum]
MTILMVSLHRALERRKCASVHNCNK